MEPAYLSRFVKGATQGSSTNEDIVVDHGSSSRELSNDVRTFYENVVGLERTETSPTGPEDKEGYDRSSVEKGDSCTRKRHCRCTSCNTVPRIKISSECNLREGKELSTSTSSKVLNDLFRNAALGNTSKVEVVLSRCGSQVLDEKDKYGWTLLMTAASKGQEDMVSFLLERGADTTAVDLAGNDARTIALKARHYIVADLFQGYVRGSYRPESQETLEEDNADISVDSDSDTVVLCEACKFEYNKSEEKKHISSTAHLFNYNKNRMPPNHNAPIDNIGYQMMLRSGWEDGQGLGPSGQGGTELVATVLKTDRSGVGSQKQKKRVTHFQSFDDKAVKVVRHKDLMRTPGGKVLKKRERLKQQRKSKQWEINLRSYMNQP